MTDIKIGNKVKIIGDFYASNEATKLAKRNGHDSWLPIGIVKKVPHVDDKYKINKDNGPEWEIPDEFNVELDVNPAIKEKKTVIITFLSRKDLENV